MADPTVEVLSGDPIISEARKRWNRCSEWEGTARPRFIDDIKFRHGDSANGYQWPNAIRQARGDSRPCLTMNIVRQHNLMISNQLKKNKSSVKFVGTGGGASQLGANVLKDLMRRIEYQSNAQAAYSCGREFQIDGGIGYWRLITKCSNPSKSMEQDIYIMTVDDPLSVYMDPDIPTNSNGLEARFAFVFDEMPEDEFDEAYPRYKNKVGQQPLGIGSANDDWVTKDYIRVCEYFRQTSKEDTLVSFVYMGERKVIRKSFLEGKMLKLLDDPLTKVMDFVENEIEWFLIAGERIIDRTKWLGRYIPLVRCVGEETKIDGILDRKGHTRAMLDAQRMYNYNSSAQVEFVALQGKTPWVGPAAAIEELEPIWNTANIQNPSYLPTRHVDDEGNEIPQPKRTEPPNMSPAFEAGMQTAMNQAMMTSGQYQNQLGMMGNERTGAAIEGRKEQSDTANFHFQDNYEEALQTTGRMILDLVPKIYDTKRLFLMEAEDGTEFELEVDPAAKQVYMQHLDAQGKIIKKIFNPTIGQYDVAASVGVAYGSKREETKDALTLILTQAPALTGIIGDLLLDSMDFDKAQEAAQRLKRMVPPMALGTGPTQNEQKLQQQVTQLEAILGKVMERQGKDTLKLVAKDQKRDIEVYDAETRRMQALQKVMPTDPEGLQEVIQQLVQDSLHTALLPILQANQQPGEEEKKIEGEETAGNEPALAPLHPHPALSKLGARRAPDGEYYMLDPTRKGKYLRIAPLGQEKSSAPMGGGVTGGG